MEEASLTFHVPQAFVVDRAGRIAFIGDPTCSRMFLPKVIDGSWLASAESRNAEEERIAKPRSMLRSARCLIESGGDRD
ncbi:hypothetical protein ACOJBO_10220 [Rhizobium beringeri]